MAPFQFRPGRVPLLVSMPHTGTHLPEWLEPRLTRAAKALPDTDWHLERLYDFLDELGASVLVATHSRYVVDLNRPPDNANLYPGQDTTGVVPLDSFHKEPLYLAGFAPLDAEARASSNTGSRTTPSWPRSWRRSRRSTAMRCSGTRTRSSRNCRGSSPASCRTSISARPMESRAAPESARRCSKRSPDTARF